MPKKRIQSLKILNSTHTMTENWQIASMGSIVDVTCLFTVSYSMYVFIAQLAVLWFY
jgi:hypothetical protein